MNAERLKEEGQRLARPCVHLVDEPPDSTEIAGVWGGPGWLHKPAGTTAHRLTVDCHYLPPGVTSLSGYISIYECANDQDQDFRAVYVQDRSDSDLRQLAGTPLYRRVALSLPPIEAVARFGSAQLREWLQAQGVDPMEEEMGFPDAALEDAYVRVWQDNCPLYNSGIYATLGGWHFPWPDGDWFNLLTKTLLIWTFEGAEPWIEVWADPTGELQLIERIT